MHMIYIHFDNFNMHSIFSSRPPQHLFTKFSLVRLTERPLAILRRPDDMVLAFKDGVNVNTPVELTAGPALNKPALGLPVISTL